MTTFIAISDTHCQLSKVIIPEGDILLHAGDLTYRGSLSETVQELNVLAELKKRFKHVVIISGNHDFLDEKQPGIMRMLCDERDITYLNQENQMVEGFSIFGSPYTPEFHNWAFNLPRGEALQKKWEAISSDTDIIITHGPPAHMLDLTEYSREHVGCADLARKIIEIKPKVHIFGHIHETYGDHWYKNTRYINASICDLDYRPINKPWVFQL